MAKSARYAIGIDIGGTGIKGGVVDCKKGKLLGKRCKEATPPGAAIADVRAAVLTLLERIRAQELDTKVPALDTLPIGICMPAVIRHGRSMSAANIAPDWVGFDARSMFVEALGTPVSLVNDADAAGVAEVKFGNADAAQGSVLVLTLGTGIGSALVYRGDLFPNTELGHMELDGHTDYERYASAKVREREGIDDATWCARLSPYFRKLEALFSPDVFVISGGISKRATEFIPLIDVDTPIVPAKLKNNAGIIGAALLGASGWE